MDIDKRRRGHSHKAPGHDCVRRRRGRRKAERSEEQHLTLAGIAGRGCAVAPALTPGCVKLSPCLSISLLERSELLVTCDSIFIK